VNVRYKKKEKKEQIMERMRYLTCSPKKGKKREPYAGKEYDWFGPTEAWERGKKRGNRH